MIAKEVAKVNPDLVVRDRKGGIYSVRYEAVNVLLLDEFLKEHRRVQTLRSALAKDEADIKALNELKATVAKQEATINALTASLKEQAKQIQQVNLQIELSKPAPQVAAGTR